MKKFNLRRFVENKYSHLLVAIVFFFLAAPFIEKHIDIVPITRLLLLITIILTMRIIKVGKIVYGAVIFLGASALVLEYFMNRDIVLSTNGSAFIVLLLIYTLFVGATIMFLTKDIFSEKRVTGDTIKGGISIYLLMGFGWVFLYYLVLALDPNSIVSTVGEKLDFVRLYQYSFTTLTTVGYGNTIPRSEMAITLSNFEAVAGQVYLTVFIARLVGMHLVAKTKGKWDGNDRRKR